MWLAYLNENQSVDEILNSAGSMVSPHRVETAEMLKYFIDGNDSWLLKYYLGLIYWNKGLIEEAKELYLACNSYPDSYSFWLSKAELFAEDDAIVAASVQKAYKLEPGSWRTALALSENYIENGSSAKAAKICEGLLPAHPENPKLGLCYARALYKDEQYKKCLNFLEKFVILPYEASVDGKLMYSELCIKLAVESIQERKYKTAVAYAEKAKLWPVNLGVGRPYDVDERLEDFLIAFALEAKTAKPDYAHVAAYKHPESQRESSLLFLQLLAMEKEGKKDEALKLISRNITSDPGNIYLKWAEAKFTGDSEQDRIENNIRSGDQEIGAYDTKFVDKGFVFLLEILEILNL